MLRSGLCVSALALASALAMAATAPATVTVENKTRSTTCAEEDNVSLTLRAPSVAGFRVEALQPDYLDSIDKDRTAPDFSGCNFDGGAHPTDPSFAFQPRSVVLHEDRQWRIVGITLPTFWRPNRVPVHAGGRSGDDFHLVQVFAKKPGRKPQEALVLYPADGYWRIKPLPLPRFGDGVYGSSILMGPVETDGRPVVNIASITIRPRPLSIRLRFTRGGSADVRVAEISERRTALDVALTPPVTGEEPFAVLRSMYVAPDNADVSELRWRASAASPDSAVRPLPEVSTLEAASVRFGRSLPSRHNTSAPDIEFSRFRTARPD